MNHTEYMRGWHKKHPNYAKEQYRKHRTKESIEKARVKSRKYYEDNKEYVKARERALYHKTKILRGRAVGNRAGTWKGDKVGYSGLHYWILKWKKRPNYCEFCKRENVKFNWASKSREYNRDLEDWINLCCKCHYHYDKQNERKRDWHGKLI